MSDDNSKKINIGIVLYKSKLEGLFQLSLSVADCLLKYSSKFKYTILYYDTEMLQWLTAYNDATEIIQVEKRTALQRINTYANILLSKKLLPMTSKKQSSAIKSANIDLLIMPFPGIFGFMNDTPYIAAISSMMHKYYTKPPYGYSWGENFIVDVVIKNSAKFSVFSVVDSHQGMDDLNKFYGVLKEKIRIIPHKPAGYIYDNSGMDIETAKSILKKYSLPKKYIFYPAQYAYYKNHLRLIQSLRRIDQLYKIRIPLLLAGRPYESHVEIMHMLQKFNMEDQVLCLGFVPEREIVALYKMATSLVFPSLWGPTNLPPLEAMIMGTPVLCSNLFSMPEQVGNAGLLFDPFSIEDMAEKIYVLWCDENLQGTLRQNGYAKIKELTQENYARQWERVIDDALQLVQKS